MSLIKTAKQVVNLAVRKIMKFQSGEEKPLTTRFKHFNDSLLGGIYPGSIITICGTSGSGKSYFLQQLEEDIMDAEMNQNALDEDKNPYNDTVLLRCNWEMTVFKLTLRRLKAQLNKTIRSILSPQEITEDSRAKYKEVFDEERHHNIFYLEEPCDPNQFLTEVDAFCKDHIDRKHIVVTVDHIALVRDMFGSKKKAMDQLVESINILKKRYNNLSFILLSQLNREIESRTNPKEAAPVRSDLYNTDTIYQISDIVIVRHNPYKMRLFEKYMVFPVGDYMYLEEFFEEKSLKGTKWRSFYTKNLIFYHYLKLRDSDDSDFIVKDIFIDYMYPPNTSDKYEKGVVIKEEHLPSSTQEVFTSVDEIPKAEIPLSTEEKELKTKMSHGEPDDDLPF